MSLLNQQENNNHNMTQETNPRSLIHIFLYGLGINFDELNYKNIFRQLKRFGLSFGIFVKPLQDGKLVEIKIVKIKEKSKL